MKTVKDILHDADPIQRETPWTGNERDFRRQAVLAAAAPVTRAPDRMRWRPRLVLAALALVAIVASLLGLRVWSPLVGNLQAAVRFEVRLAENQPGPGLRPAMVSGSGRSIYLHEEVVVDNGDIATARVIPGDGSSQHSVGVEFNAAGAAKIRAATEGHIGKPVAILLDGQVVMTPVVRVPIGGSAVITGNFSEAQAERIVKGIGIP